MDWKQILAPVDDDYLVGISNKGIVKRAYKDFESLVEQQTLDSTDSALTLSVGSETVTLTQPLGASTCSCPSRSICRHIVLGILLAKKALCKQPPNAPDAFKATAPIAEKTHTLQAPETDAAAQPAPEQNPLLTQVLEEIRQYPYKRLLRALNTNALRTLAAQMQAGQMPEIEYSSAITVRLSEDQAVVHLLAPLAHATCTCHKKELCSHKAKALLWCQWNEHLITAAQLEKEIEQAPVFDRAHIQAVAKQIQTAICELLHMGLCRTSADTVYTFERLAISAHNVQLPRIENELRALASVYERYVRRSATYSITDNLRLLLNLYKSCTVLLTASENSTIEQLAGSFHAQYHPIGNLDLVGIAWEHFVSSSGYEGDTIYFLETETKKWYTYTAALPTFYDGKPNRRNADDTPAPWGLSLPLTALVEYRFRLTHAKCDASGRLSSSQETTAELVGKRTLTEELLQGWFFKDFSDIFDASQPTAQQQTQMFVCLQPAAYAPASFDKITQTLQMPLFDADGREIFIEVPYSKRESETIRYLERFQETPPPCVVGRLYLKESRLRLYPLELWDSDALPFLYTEKNSAPEPAAKKYEKQPSCEAVLDLLDELESSLCDLYQTGFDAVPDAILQQLHAHAEMTQRFGMAHVWAWLSQLAEMLDAQRHRIRTAAKQPDTGSCEQYRLLWEYTARAKRQAAYDLAAAYYHAKADSPCKTP